MLVIALTPLILEKGLVWFEKNERRIEKVLKSSFNTSIEARLQSPRSASSFWQKNTLIIESGQKILLSEFTRKLSDFGYEKYQRVELPGEFSQIGGALTVFPINMKSA